MSSGRRYDNEPKLNLKKVFAVIIAIIVIIMVIIGINKLLSQDKENGRLEGKTYFSIYTDGKWGVMDSKADIIIPADYTEMIVIPDNKTDIFLCIYDVDYNNNVYKTKVLNSKGEAIFTEYELVESLYNYDINHNLYYEENILKVRKDGKYGLIDFNGKVLIDCQYEQIDTLKGVKNSILITKEQKLGLTDNEGNIIIEPIYKEIKSFGTNYQDGYQVINEENKVGVIDFNKTTILQCKYDEIKTTTSSGMYVVKTDGKLKVIDKNEQVVLEDKFEDVKSINGENVVFVTGGKQGIIGKDGQVKVQADYEELKYIFSDNYIAKKDGKKGIINIANEIKMNFEYSEINYIPTADIIQAQKESETQAELFDREFNSKLTAIVSKIDLQKGYMRLRIGEEYHYYNFKFEEKQEKDIFTNNNLFLSKKDGKYGYVDKDGNVVVDYIYEDAMPQNAYGYVAVKKDGKWGSLNKDTNIVSECKYTLENNLKIDFIGKWHYAEDINANYYTDI